MTFSSKNRSGMTLIEIMVVVALMATLMGITAFTMGMVGRGDVQSQALKLSAQIRYVYHQAAFHNQNFQMIIDLDNAAYWVESINISGALSKDELAGSQLLKERAEQRAERIDDEDQKFFGLSHREPVSDFLIEKTQLPEGVVFVGVQTSHHEQMQTQGLATINFFPNGYVEQSVILLGARDGKEEEKAKYIHTLIVHPLTGYSEVIGREIDIDRAFFEPEEED